MSNQDEQNKPTGGIVIRKPTIEDGQQIHSLIANCPPLDQNSLYCNLLQCHHFSDTSALAERNEVIGFVSGYLVPGEVDTLFIWQVAVDERVRGNGLAGKMISAILARPSCQNVRYIKTTITLENTASWALFEKLAFHLKSETFSDILFRQDMHLGQDHESEYQLVIGPFKHRVSVE